MKPCQPHQHSQILRGVSLVLIGSHRSLTGFHRHHRPSQASPSLTGLTGFTDPHGSNRLLWSSQVSIAPASFTASQLLMASLEEAGNIQSHSLHFPSTQMTSKPRHCKPVRGCHPQHREVVWGTLEYRFPSHAEEPQKVPSGPEQ